MKRNIFIGVFLCFILNVELLINNKIHFNHLKNTHKNIAKKTKNIDNNNIISNDSSFNVNEKITSLINREEKNNIVKENTTKVYIQNPSNLNYTYKIVYQTYDKNSKSLKSNQIDYSNNNMQTTLINNNGQNVFRNSVFDIKIQINGAFQGLTRVLLNPKYKQMLELQELSGDNISYSIKASGILTCPNITLYENYKDIDTGKSQQIPIGSYQVYNYYQTNFNWSSQVMQLALITVFSAILVAAGVVVGCGILYKFKYSILNRVLSLDGEVVNSDILLDENIAHHTLEGLNEQNASHNGLQESSEKIRHPLESDDEDDYDLGSLHHNQNSNHKSNDAISTNNSTIADTIDTREDRPAKIISSSSFATNTVKCLGEIENEDIEFVNPFLVGDEKVIPTGSLSSDVEMGDAFLIRQREDICLQEESEILTQYFEFEKNKDIFEYISKSLLNKRQSIDDNIELIRRDLSVAGESTIINYNKFEASNPLITECKAQIINYRNFIRSRELFTQNEYIYQSLVRQNLLPENISCELLENDDVYYIRNVLDEYIRQSNNLIKRIHENILDHIKIFQDISSWIDTNANDELNGSMIYIQMNELSLITCNIQRLHSWMTNIECYLAKNIIITSHIVNHDWNIDTFEKIKTTKSLDFFNLSLDNINGIILRRQEIFSHLEKIFAITPRWIRDTFEWKLNEYIRECNFKYTSFTGRILDISSSFSKRIIKSLEECIYREEISENNENARIQADRLREAQMNSQYLEWNSDPKYNKLLNIISINDDYIEYAKKLLKEHTHFRESFEWIKDIFLSELNYNWTTLEFNSKIWEEVHFLRETLLSLETINFRVGIL